MYKTTARSKRANHYNVYNDLAKIKDAFADATYGMRNHAGDVISKSIDDVKEKSTVLQENVSSYVSDKPLKSVGLALLAGIFLGYFIHK
jgi:ElaB/YqjD/DUF883 family membrane-anchored ribosome-binding protein